MCVCLLSYTYLALTPSGYHHCGHCGICAGNLLYHIHTVIAYCGVLEFNVFLSLCDTLETCGTCTLIIIIEIAS